ncbi:hypothetical protein PR001_g22767 [Phytophthora rubi]|nr:hypothetical protein PR001_g22767 [Phytophthora rubi]
MDHLYAITQCGLAFYGGGVACDRDEPVAIRRLQYQAVLSNDEVNQLRGAQYAYALWGALFAVPVRVLTESEELW